MLHVVENDSSALIGMCGLRTVDFGNRNAEVGIILYHEFWNKGYCTDAHLEVLTFAFERLKLHRIFACTSPQNGAMRGFFEKFGFSLESVEKESIFARGKYTDMCVYVLLESGWENAKKKMQTKLESIPAKHIVKT